MVREQEPIKRPCLRGEKKRAFLEDERCRRLQEIVFRVAAERSIRRYTGYEEAVSMGYLGLLRFLRRGDLKFENEVHEQRMAAQAIRWAIVDQKRAQGPHTRRYDGQCRRRYEDLTLTDIAQEDEKGELYWPDVAEWREGPEEGNDLWRAVCERLSAVPIDWRIPEMVWMRVRGHTLKEIGERFGVTETRAWQIFNRAKPMLEEQILPLLQVG